MSNNYKTTENNSGRLAGFTTGVNNNFFELRVSNPTNDIIFTKMDVVEKQLDVIESQDPEAFNSLTNKYCDIGCKSGAYLIGIANRIFNSSKAKELYGEGKELARWRHIFRYQVFGVVSNEILQQVSQMRIYDIIDKDGETLFDDCWSNIISTDLLDDPSKFDPADIMKRFNEIDNFTTVEDINKYGEREIKKMSFEKFDYIIGNPPYKTGTRGDNSPTWYKIINKASKISNKMCMIHPGRWATEAEDKTKDGIIKNGLSFFSYYTNSNEIFEGVDITGGISITYFDRTKDKIYYSVNESFKGLYNSEEKIFENEFEIEALNKIWLNKEKTIEDRIIWGDAGYNRKSQQNLLVSDENLCDNPIKIWSNIEKGNGAKYSWYYIDKKYLDNNKYSNISKSRKIMMSSSGNSKNGFGNIINNNIQIVDKEVIGANIFFVYPENDINYELELIKSYFETRTIRFLMSITQKNMYVKGFENVPDYTYFIDELNGELFTDEFFYNKYNFSQELIDYIESHIAAK